MIIRKKKGLLVKDKNGYEKICKVEKQGYTCNEQNEKKLFELLLPSVPWHFSFGKDGLTFLPLKITKKDCLGYDDGYQCPGEDPVYIEYFWARFLPNVSYNDGFIKSPTEPNNLCYELKNGYLCPGDLPVMDNRNELFYKYDEHKGIFISDKDNPKDTKICRYYDNFKTYSDIGYECNGEKVVILKKRPTTINYKGSKKWGTESQMRTDIISKRYKIIECSQFVNGYTYCPGEEDSPSYGTFPLQPGDKPTPSPFPKTKTIYDYQNGKYYTLIEEPNGNYTIKPGQGWIR